MVTIPDMYQFYNHNINVEMLDIDDKIKSLEATREYATARLQPYENIIALYSSKDFKSCLRNSAFQNPIILTYATMLQDVDTQLDKLAKRKVKLKSSQVTLDEYRFIVKQFNQALINRMVDKAFRLGITGLGSLGFKTIFKKEDSKRQYVDWGASNKRKNELIAQGKTPLKGDNGGVEWLRFHTKNYVIFFKWLKEGCSIPNVKLIGFEEALNIRKRINATDKMNPIAYLKY